MTTITRRRAILGASALASTPLVFPAKAAAPHELRAGIQALVRDIRTDRIGSGGALAAVAWAGLQYTADRLEALPGIEPVPNAVWARLGPRWRVEMLKIDQIGA